MVEKSDRHRGRALLLLDNKSFRANRAPAAAAAAALSKENKFHFPFLSLNLWSYVWNYSQLAHLNLNRVIVGDFNEATFAFNKLFK